MGEERGKVGPKVQAGLISLSKSSKILIFYSYRELDYWSLDTLCIKSPEAFQFI
ncbi:MAG: hypothetical protein ABGW77_05840 [Campylobacterales bacterium]